MKHFLILCFFSITVLLSSCKCDELNCDGFDTKYSSWLVYQNQQTVTFTNNTTDIVLSINNRGVSSPYAEEVKWSSLGGCHSNHDCTQSAKVEGQFNTSINSYSSYKFRIRDLGFDKLSTYITLFDFNDGFIVKPELELADTLQNFHNNINLNGIDYTNVISIELDTLTTYNQDKHIWKIFYSEEKGIIAFADRNTNSTYYLKP